MKISSGILLTMMLSCHVFGQEVFNKDLYSPMPMPHFTPPKDSLYKENKLAVYDMTDMRFDTLDESNLGKTVGGKLFSRPSKLSLNEFIKKGNQQGYAFTNLQPADQLSGFPNYPISTIVKLYLKIFNPSSGSYSYTTCSGTIIHPNFIMTAGHCVKSNLDNSYAVECLVVPADNMNSKPYGQTTTTKWYSFTQWTQNGNWDYDMAILSLSNSIGNNVGWLGWGSNMDNNFFITSNNIFHSFGYPASDDFGNPVFEAGKRMYYMNGYMDFWKSKNVVCHNNIGFHGQSGSGLYYRDVSNNRYVYAVLSHGNGKTMPYYTCHCRMDSDMYNYFKSIIPVPTSIKHTNVLKEGIKVSPNPSTGFFNIKVGKNNFKKCTIRVVNLLGKEIITKSIVSPKVEMTIDMREYPTGVYYIVSTIDGNTISDKIYRY